MVAKNEEKYWREYYAREARRHWLEFPWELLGVFTAIIGCNDYTSERKVKQIQWAMDAYNKEMKEAANNGKNLSD